MGEHYISAGNLSTLPDVIDYWLQSEQDSARARMAATARQFVLEQHTWNNRVEMVLGVIGRDQSGRRAS